MKRITRLFFLVLISILCTKAAFAQHQKIIEPYATNFQYLDSLITIDSTNAKTYSDYVYVLRRGGFYLVHNQIKNNGWTLRVKAEPGTGPRPIIYLTKNPTAANNPGRMWYAYGNLELTNLVMDGINEWDTTDPLNITYMQGSLINANAAGFYIKVDSCVMTNTNGNHIRTDKAPTVVKVTNSLFANMGYLGNSNFGAGKAIDLRAGSCDSLILVNNTFINGQDRVVRHYTSTANIKYMKFDHNTVVNNMSYHGMLSLGKVGKNMQITNNLFYDGFALGNDTDKVRQVEFADGKEKDQTGNWRMSWIISEPNDSTNWNIAKNYYVVSSDGQAWYNKYTAAGVTGEGSPLTWHIGKKIGADSLNVIKKATGVVLNRIPKLMTAMMDWYRSPSGGNKTKATNTWALAYDYNRKSVKFYTDSLSCTYSTTSVPYRGAERGFPAGDLNWYPSLKAQWAAGGTIGVTEELNLIPVEYKLDQNYPNPFNPTTNIAYSLPKASNVTISIYNSIGQEIAVLINNQSQNAGKHQITWNGKDASGRVVATGVYFYQMRTNDFTMTKKMLLLK